MSQPEDAATIAAEYISSILDCLRPLSTTDSLDSFG